MEGHPLARELDSARVAQTMGMYAPLDARTPTEPRQKLAQIARVQWPAAERAKESGAERESLAERGPLGDDGERVGIERHGASSAAFALPHPHGPALPVHVVVGQCETLGPAQPGPPQHDDDGAVTWCSEAATRCIEHRLYFLACEDLRVYHSDNWRASGLSSTSQPRARHVSAISSAPASA